MAAYYHSRYGYIRRKKKKGKAKALLIILLVVIILGSAGGYTIYHLLYKPNVWIENQSEKAIYIPTGSSFSDVKNILYSQGMIIHRNSFEWVAEKKKYDRLVKPGKYVIRNEMNNNDIINLLRSGVQTPVNLIFNNVRDTDHLASIVARQIEADEASIKNLLADSTFLSRFDLSVSSASMIFIPNTYEFFWNTGAEDFIKRMIREYKRFWNESRIAKCNKTGLSREEVIILASIIEKETVKDDEKPTIAGVYINRLERGWLLQADPTVVYATGDFSINRVLNYHKEIDSPYNTYKYGGLPPGPICIPSIASIDAVLNYEKHDYLYFCAREDFSGYHNFSESYRQHLKNARKYQQALNERRIMN